MGLSQVLESSWSTSPVGIAFILARNTCDNSLLQLELADHSWILAAFVD